MFNFPQITQISADSQQVYFYLRKPARSAGKNNSEMEENDLSFKIRGCIFKVYNSLGPGLLESVYKAALQYELHEINLNVKTQKPIPVIYNEIKLDLGFRADIIVNDKVLIEIKSVENIAEVHHKQVLTYLKLTGIKLGILVNFNTDNIADSIFRKVNKL